MVLIPIWCRVTCLSPFCPALSRYPLQATQEPSNYSTHHNLQGSTRLTLSDLCKVLRLGKYLVVLSVPFSCLGNLVFPLPFTPNMRVQPFYHKIFIPQTTHIRMNVLVWIPNPNPSSITLTFNNSKLHKQTTLWGLNRRPNSSSPVSRVFYDHLKIFPNNPMNPLAF